MNNPVVLITGAGKGLGRAIAEAFADQNFAVAFTYSKSKNEADSLSATLTSQGVPVLALPMDVRKSTEVNQTVDQVANKWGRIDVLVNNAGIARDNSVIRMTDEEWNDVLQVNLSGPFYTTRAVLPLMRKQKNGSILNISSFISRWGSRGASNYAASKAGLETFTKNVALEEGRHQIRSNAVMPGFHVTDLNRKVWDKIKDAVMAQHVLGKLPDRMEMAKFVVGVATCPTISGQIFSFESRVHG